MKKVLTILVLAAVMLSMAACGNGADAPQEPEPPKAEKVTETKYMKVDGIYVDNAYRDEDNDKLRMVYLFYTASTEDQNLSVDSKSTKITINDVNTYKAEHYPDSCDYMSSYYYGSYLKDVYVGDSLKIVETVQIPEGDLAAGKTLTFAKDQIPDTGALRMSTDDLIFCEGVEEIAKAADAEGYASELDKRTDADESTITQVKNAINGYYWSFYVNSTSYRLEFTSPDVFKLSALGASNSGKYTVKKGYIFCTYDTGIVVEIPYFFEDNQIKLDTVAAFDVRAS